MTGRPSIELVLPCLDEQDSLPALIASVPDDWAVLVVDNGSRDRSAEVARRAGARVVMEPQRGYGAAVHAGLLAARGRIVVVLDADGSVRPGDAAPLVADVVEDGCDLACGERVPVPGAMPWHARAGNRLLTRALAWRTGCRLRDIPAVRVGRRAELLGLGVVDRRFGYPLETVVRAAQAGWRIGSRPVAYYPRTAGTSKVSASARGSVAVVRDMAGVLAR